EDVGGGLRPDQCMQPGRMAAPPPAGLVGHHPVRLSHGLADSLIDRLAAGGGPQDGVDATAAAEGDAKETSQAAGDLAMREPALLVKFNDSSLRIGSELRGSGAEGVGRLQGMPPLNPPATQPTLADVDIELAVDGLARDLDLELLGNVGLVEWAGAVGAAIGQRRRVDLGDLFGGGRLAMGLCAGVRAPLAPRA